ncbi:MAG: hypothetical protein HY026_07025 [Deltaproteobacteria bacterium]|nr:hypothetical protein [Deltaproteobacteria bacterium]
MECMYLEKNGICTASLSKMIPSVLERLAYCDTEEHYRCPILIAHTLARRAQGRGSAGRNAVQQVDGFKCFTKS